MRCVRRGFAPPQRDSTLFNHASINPPPLNPHTHKRPTHSQLLVVAKSFKNLESVITIQLVSKVLGGVSHVWCLA